MDTYITVKQAAERLGVAPATVHNYIQRGDLTGYRVRPGRKVLVRAEDVRRLATPTPIVRPEPKIELNTTTIDDLADYYRPR